MAVSSASDPLLDAGRDGLGALPSAAVNGTTLAYRDQGAGEPVVLVHGSASDIRTWDGVLPALVASHRAIAYSRRYARPNEEIPPGVDDQMLAHVNDLVGLLEELGAAPAHLIGHSWGGFICLLTAIRYPDAVRSLVLEEPPVVSLFVSTHPRPGELARLFASHPKTALSILRFGVRTIAPAERAFRRGDDEEGMKRFGSGVLGRTSYANVPEERRQQMRENVGALRAQVTGAGFPPLAEEDVRRVAAPVLLLTGERSPVMLRRLTGHLQDLLPAAERAEIPDASHRLHEENPAAASGEMIAFLGSGASPNESVRTSERAA